MSATKRCSKCGRTLPLSSFHKTRRSKDGYQWRCRECVAEYHHKQYESGAALEERVKVCEARPTGKKARLCVALALKAGRLTRPHTCSGCGCTDTEHRIEAHHADYSRPLDVIWLCPMCHRRIDAVRRQRNGKPPYARSKA